MYKVALWGMGEGYNLFIQLHGHEQVQVVAITDNLVGGVKSLDNIPVVPPSELSMYAFDYLIVSVIDNNTYKSIADEATALGIDRETIFPLWIFKIAYFDFDKYIQIRESNISILSDYCFAGFLYHSLGMQFTSPTILLTSDNDNYYRFLCNIKHYLNYPMREIKDTINRPCFNHLSYPGGIVDDVEWWFAHSVTYAETEKKWTERAKRFNYDNFLVTMTIRSDEMAEKFNELPIKNKIGFYWKDLGLDSVVCLPQWNDPTIRAQFNYDFAVLVNRIANETCGIRAINWMKALLHEKDFLRIQA